MEIDSLRVFVVSDSLLFSASLKNLLTPEADIQIIGEEVDVNHAVAEIKALKPDVVIYGNTGLSSDPVLEEIYLLKATPPGIKVISLSLQDNQMFIYKSAHQVVHDFPDLVEAISMSLFLTLA